MSESSRKAEHLPNIHEQSYRSLLSPSSWSNLAAFTVKPRRPGAGQGQAKKREKSTPSRARLRDISAVSKQHQQEESLDDFQARLTGMRPKISF